MAHAIGFCLIYALVGTAMVATIQPIYYAQQLKDHQLTYFLMIIEDRQRSLTNNKSGLYVTLYKIIT